MVKLNALAAIAEGKKTSYSLDDITKSLRSTHDLFKKVKDNDQYDSFITKLGADGDLWDKYANPDIYKMADKMHYHQDLDKKLNAYLAKTVKVKNQVHEAKGEYTTFASWKRAIKAKYPDFWLDGDADIASAMVGEKPFKRGKTRSVGEWDGSVGDVQTPIKESDELVGLGKSLKTKPAEAATPAQTDVATDTTVVDKPAVADVATDAEAPAIEFSVGQKVRPKVGPHKGELHTIASINGDVINIVPADIPKEQIKYPQGVGAKAKADQLELADDDVKPITKEGLFRAVMLDTNTISEAGRTFSFNTGKEVDTKPKGSGEVGDAKKFKLGQVVKVKKGGKEVKVLSFNKDGTIRVHSTNPDDLPASLKGKVVSGKGHYDLMPSELMSLREGRILEALEKGESIEAYGVKGMKSTQWRKTFKSEAAFEKWTDDNDAEVYGFRVLTKGGDVKQQLAEELEKGEKIEAYGVKGMKSTQWRKTFKSEAAFDQWTDDNDAEVLGYRVLKANGDVKGLNESIEDVKLTSRQRAHLERQLEKLFTDENIEVTGFEVTHVQDEDDGELHKAFYEYEGANRKKRAGNIYFTGNLSSDGYMDFQEKKF